jgi:hypothetical protein
MAAEARAHVPSEWNHTYNYRSVLETSQRVNWKLEEVIKGRTLDFSRPFLPDSLAGLSTSRCLNAKEKLKLNQIRGFTYLYLFGLVEEYILPSVIDHTRDGVNGDDDERRALLRFAEEEAKHIQLFKWFVREFEDGFSTSCDVIGPPREIAAAILNHAPLGVFLTTLHIEWMTQKHYVESVQITDESLDRFFCSLLKHHWIEESQHAKLDTLVVDKLASTSTEGHREGDRRLHGHRKVARRRPPGSGPDGHPELGEGDRPHLHSAEREEIERAQLKSYRWTFLLSGMTHPNLDRSLRELSAPDTRRGARARHRLKRAGCWAAVRVAFAGRGRWVRALLRQLASARAPPPRPGAQRTPAPH